MIYGQLGLALILANNRQKQIGVGQEKGKEKGRGESRRWIWPEALSCSCLLQIFAANHSNICLELHFAHTHTHPARIESSLIYLVFNFGAFSLISFVSVCNPFHQFSRFSHAFLPPTHIDTHTHTHILGRQIARKIKLKLQLQQRATAKNISNKIKRNRKSQIDKSRARNWKAF